MNKKLPTRQLILEAAIRCIEKRGLDHVTTRAIAEEAGTNIASINYHFRSKDELISQTLSTTLQHMLDDVMLELARSDASFEATLREVFRYLLEGSRRYPGVSRAHLSLAISSRRGESVSARAMLKVFNGLMERAVQAYPHKRRKVLTLRLAQVMNAILFVLLVPDFFKVRRGKGARLHAGEHAEADSYASLFLRSI